MNELIKVEQLPIIKERLKDLSNEIDEKVANAVALVCTEDTVKSVKEIRAELNNNFKELETQRKQVKEAVTKPYNEFEKIFKEYVTDKFKLADEELKYKIDDVEDRLKEEKRKEIEAYFEEYRVSKNIDFIKFEDANIKVGLSDSKKSLKEKCTAFVDKIEDDLKLINTQEHKEEILVEYMKNLDVSKSILEVTDRHMILDIINEKETKKEEEQMDAIMLEKIETLSAPKEVDNEIYELLFKVRGTKAQLKALKEFLNNGGYYYE